MQQQKSGIQLIDNAKNWWKIWSVQVFGLIAFLSLLQQNWPAFQQFVPQQYHGYVISFFAFVGAVTRLIKQLGLSQPDQPDLPVPNSTEE